MNNKSTESKAATVSVGAVVIYVICSGVINFARLASEPWHRSPLFAIGGSLLATIALIAGAFAFVRGRSSLDPRHRQFAITGIIAGVSYLSAIAIKLSTD